MRFDLVSILILLGTLGLGVTLGVYARQRFSQALKKELVLFEARTKVYSRIMSRVLNAIQEPDVSVFSEPMKLAELNEIFSEVFVFAGPELAHLIQKFVLKEYEFRVELGKKNLITAKYIHSEMAVLAEEMHAAMRAELLVDPVRPEDRRKLSRTGKGHAGAAKGRAAAAHHQPSGRRESPPVPPLKL